MIAISGKALILLILGLLLSMSGCGGASHTRTHPREEPPELQSTLKPGMKVRVRAEGFGLIEGTVARLNQHRLFLKQSNVERNISIEKVSRSGDGTTE